MEKTVLSQSRNTGMFHHSEDFEKWKASSHRHIIREMVKWSSTVLPKKQLSVPILPKTTSQVPFALICQNETLLELIQCFRLQNNQVSRGQRHYRVRSPMLIFSHNNMGCCLMIGIDGTGEKEKTMVRLHMSWEGRKFLGYMWKDLENLH